LEVAGNVRTTLVEKKSVGERLLHERDCHPRSKINFVVRRNWGGKVQGKIGLEPGEKPNSEPKAKGTELLMKWHRRRETGEPSGGRACKGS